jgi:hypothetical protein
MRKLVFIGLTGVLLGLLGCSGSDSPTEPGSTAPPGNWAGTITGKHEALHLDGSCAMTMNLDPAFNGQWRVDCPGGGGRGEVLSVLSNNVVIMALTTIDPASPCPWTASAATAGSTIDGQFQVTDCSTHAVIGSGTIQLRRQ